MIKSSPFTIEVPYLNSIADKNSGLAESSWQQFFRAIRDSINSLGNERSFALENNISVATDVDGLSFDKKRVSVAFVDFLIQRVTTDTGAQEKIESGTFIVHFLPTSESWTISNDPSTAGITLTITAGGQVQYESTNLTGVSSISKITWKARTLASKNSQYSGANK